MRILAYFLLSSSAFGQTQAPPTVRDTYVRAGNPRVVSLKDSLIVVVCKTEYEAWAKDKTPPPALSLYMNGLLMKGPVAVHPAPPTDKLDDPQAKKVKEACRTSAEVAASDANKDASDKAKAEKEAAAVKAPADKEVSTKEGGDQGRFCQSRFPADGRSEVRDGVLSGFCVPYSAGQQGSLATIAGAALAELQ